MYGGTTSSISSRRGGSPDRSHGTISTPSTGPTRSIHSWSGSEITGMDQTLTGKDVA